MAVFYIKKIRLLVFTGLFLFSVMVFLVHYFISGQAVYGDGIGYYSHLHSWVIDGDWDYTNEYKHLYDHEHNNSDLVAESPVVQIVPTTDEGRAENFYGTGVAVLLLPFYFLAHTISIAVNLFGAHLPVSGYGDLYQIFSGIGAIVYTIWGVRLLEKLVSQKTKCEEAGLVSGVTMFLATSLLYYGSFDVLNSHFASFFLASAFFYVFFLDKPSQLWLGFIAGLMTITRLQDGVILLIWFVCWIRKGGEKWVALKNFIVGFGFGLIPLFIHWGVVFGNPLKHTYLRGLVEKYAAGTTIDYWGSLLNPVTGLLVRTPLLMVLLGYLLVLVFKRKANGLFYLGIFFAMQYLIITVQGGWAAAAYGGRMYMSSSPLFGVLLGMFYSELKHRGRLVTRGALAVFIVLNILSMGVFILRDKGTEGGGVGTEKRTLLRINQFFGK